MGEIMSQPDIDPELDDLADEPLRDVKTIHCRGTDENGNACSRKVVLSSGWANKCPNFENCQSEYNGAGQRLAPRSQWGEETGEQF
jgi:hypothetical protein